MYELVSVNSWMYISELSLRIKRKKKKFEKDAVKKSEKIRKNIINVKWKNKKKNCKIFEKKFN